MDAYHYSKLLQIVGVVFETGVVSVILNDELVYSFAEKRIRKLSGILSQVFEGGRFSMAQRLLMPKEGFPFRLRMQLVLSIVVFVVWSVLIGALLSHNRELAWFGSLFLLGVALWMTIDVWLLPFTNRPHKYTLALLVFLWVMRLFNVLVLFPILETVLLSSIRVAYGMFVLLKSLAKLKVYRFAFSLFGFVLILAGMIWEYLLLN